MSKKNSQAKNLDVEKVKEDLGNGISIEIIMGLYGRTLPLFKEPKSNKYRTYVKIMYTGILIIDGKEVEVTEEIDNIAYEEKLNIRQIKEQILLTKKRKTELIEIWQKKHNIIASLNQARQSEQNSEKDLTNSPSPTQKSPTMQIVKGNQSEQRPSVDI